VFAKAEYEDGQPGRHVLSGQVRESPLAGREPIAQNSDRLHPHLGIAAHEVVERFPFEYSQAFCEGPDGEQIELLHADVL
jgi:hypothetical protein